MSYIPWHVAMLDEDINQNLIKCEDLFQQNRSRINILPLGLTEKLRICVERRIRPAEKRFVLRTRHILNDLSN